MPASGYIRWWFFILFLRLDYKYTVPLRDIMLFDRTVYAAAVRYITNLLHTRLVRASSWRWFPLKGARAFCKIQIYVDFGTRLKDVDTYLRRPGRRHFSRRALRWLVSRDVPRMTERLTPSTSCHPCCHILLLFIRALSFNYSMWCVSDRYIKWFAAGTPGGSLKIHMLSSLDASLILSIFRWKFILLSSLDESMKLSCVDESNIKVWIVLWIVSRIFN
jgi:hypothetical protein